ncbi:HelD family protein [Enterocloster clostridioformis]|jgi:DNA helicase-2/ATP-dependent DNA helicase PcrA|uniref:HelD family protein n=1 Tax=Enterocloster clostridioformis TaxID=1531 RepID=UPI0022E979D4|nr:3'-5' exonuclease [Enterocloster clostridioformis]
MSDYPAIPFPDELVHLEQVSARLSDALQQAEASVRRADREYADTKKYMADHRGEIDPHEMFQNELLLKQTDRTGAFAVEMRDRIAKLKDSPYFARIDFREEQEEEGQPYYIGRFAFQYENEPLVFDWRAPISGMFYDCEVGAAGFMAPAGWTAGELTRKRQFKIRNGVMEYALESSANVQDDVLQRELSHTSDEKMKSIISTIQREQNQIIRNEKEGTMIIQGVAGSGKTSIALHRIAFLLYRLKDRLTARNVTILSPNKVFGDYISGVIPELGEEPIYEMSFGELAEIQLEGVIGFEPDRDPFETQDETWSERVRFKSTLDFVSLMDRYIEQLPEFIFIPTDYVYGSFSAKGEWIRDRFLAYGTCPVKKRLAMVADDIHDRFETDNIMEQEVPRPRTILKQLNSMFTMKDTLAVYKDFYKRMGIPEYFVMAARKTLEWADVYPFLYLHSAFQGLKESHITRHLVIDEMQDYTPVQYAALNRMFPCRKTILGDFGQSVNPNHLHGLEDLRTIYDRAQFVELNKSYRSTYEIMRFAKKIHHVSALEPVKRHGEPPALIPCLDAADEIRKIREAIRCFRTGKNVSLGIILKTDAAAKDMYEVLAGYDGVEENQVEENQVEGNGEEACDISLLTRESTSFQNGISITSVRMSKGLEFDEVLIPQADCRTYTSDFDRGLLYIACTRAMHRLTLTYSGKETEFISGQPPF